MKVQEAPHPTSEMAGRVMRNPLPPLNRLWRLRQREAGRLPTRCSHRIQYPSQQLPDESWEGPYVFSSQEDFSDSMPENWEDEGPGPKTVFCTPIPSTLATPRERAWHECKLEKW